MAFPSCSFRLMDPAALPGVRLGNVPDAFRCKATSKLSGKRCRCMAATGQGVCRHHGAKGLKPTQAGMVRMAKQQRGGDV